MKPVDVKSSTNIDFDVENKKERKKDSKFEIGHHLQISKFKNIFGKGCALNLSEDVCVIKKIKNTVTWMYS